MSHQSTLRFFTYFLRAYPLGSAVMVLLLILSGLAEGVGVVTLVPLLEFAQGDGSAETRLGELIVAGLDRIGLEPSLLTLLGVIVVTMTLKALMRWLAMRQVGFTVAGVTRDLRLQLLRALFQARWSYFGSRKTGGFANAVSSEAVRAATAYRQACTFFASIFQILVYVAIAAAISWRIMLFALGAGAVLALLLQVFVRMSREAGNEQTRVTKSLTGRLVDVVQGIKPVKAMSREDLVLPLLEDEAEGLNQAQRQQVLAAESRKNIHEPIVTALLAAVLFVLFSLGDQPLSAVLMLGFVFYRLLKQIHGLQGLVQSLVVGESAFWSLREEIARAEQMPERLTGGVDVERVQDGIRFEGVSFRYEEHKPILDRLDLVIPAGHFVAVAGESGSGKTTTADLLLGLHEPDDGRILVDGVPLSEISLRAWRQQIGYVPQELLLFNDTILNNITLGDERFGSEDVERALRQAEAWDFVAERPEGMDATVGDQGTMLSGGQRQRIAIARALVHRPSVLILDEVTTALDPETERDICETLKGLTPEVTILSISHQPALRKVADVSYLMRHGKLVPLEDEAVLAG